jgi:hypothetical protein
MHGAATHLSESRAGAAVGPVIVLDDGIDHERMSGVRMLIIISLCLRLRFLCLRASTHFRGTFRYIGT